MDSEPTAFDFVLPWILGSSVFSKAYHGQKLWRNLNDAVARRKGGMYDATDTIMFMMEKGDHVHEMISVSKSNRLMMQLLILDISFLVYPGCRIRRTRQYEPFASMVVHLPVHISPLENHDNTRD